MLTAESPNCLGEAAARYGGKHGGKHDKAKTALATILEEALASHVDIVDWVSWEDVQKDMRRLI